MTLNLKTENNATSRFRGLGKCVHYATTYILSRSRTKWKNRVPCFIISGAICDVMVEAVEVELIILGN